VAENQQLRVYKLLRHSVGESDKKNGDSNNDKHLTLASSQTVGTNAWRCAWNVTGTVLASSGDGGIVQLWKPSADGPFVCVSKVQGDLSQVTSATPEKETNGMNSE
jgi:nucleoporin SEH1